MGKIWFCFLTAMFSGSLFLSTSAMADKGQDVFSAKKCNMCHSVTKVKIEKKSKSGKAPDLSTVGTKLNAEAIKLQLSGPKHKKFEGSDEDLTALTTWLGNLK